MRSWKVKFTTAQKIIVLESTVRWQFLISVERYLTQFRSPLTPSSISFRRKVWTKIPIRLGGIFTRAFTIELKRFDRGKEKETRNSDAVFCVFARVYEQIRARTREESIKTWVTVDRCTSRSASNSIYLEAHRALEGL